MFACMIVLLIICASVSHAVSYCDFSVISIYCYSCMHKCGFAVVFVPFTAVSYCSPILLLLLHSYDLKK